MPMVIMLSVKNVMCRQFMPVMVAWTAVYSHFLNYVCVMGKVVIHMVKVNLNKHWCTWTFNFGW